MITRAISDWWEGIIQGIKDGLIEMIVAAFSGMFEEVNSQIGGISAQIGQSPQAWNVNIYDMIRRLSQDAILPIANIIIIIIACYEFSIMITERNNLKDFEIGLFAKWAIKTIIAMALISHSYDIIAFIFALAQQAVNASAGVISDTVDMSNMTAGLNNLYELLQEESLGSLILLVIETQFAALGMKIMAIIIFVIIYGRMIEIYLSMSVAPIPFALMINREWGQIGASYLRTMFALGFQAVLIIVCVAIYAVLVQAASMATEIHAAIFNFLATTAMLCFALFQTGTMSKKIFGV